MPEHEDLITTSLHVPGYHQAGDPGAVGAGMDWLDTTASPPTLKRRNPTNAGWDTPLSGGGAPSGAAAGVLSGTYPNPGFASVADQRILGNVSGGSAAPIALTSAQVRTMLALVIGTNVEAWSAVLDALASVMSSTATAVAQRAALVVAGYNNAGNSGTTLTIDFSVAHTQLVTLNNNCTFTFSNPVAGDVYVLHLRQDGSGSKLVTWPGTVVWPSGTAPTLTTTASKLDIITFSYNGTSYYGVTSGQNYT